MSTTKILKLKAIVLCIVVLSMLPRLLTAQPMEEWQPLDLPAASSELIDQLTSLEGPQVLTMAETPYRRAGELEGCGFTFGGLLRDWAYNRNRPVYFSGSIVYYWFANNARMMTLKLGLNDIEKRGNEYWSKNGSLEFAYLTIGDLNTSLMDTRPIESDDQSKIFAFADPDGSIFQAMVFSAFDDNNIKVGFNREEEGIDLEFTLPGKTSAFGKVSADTNLCLAELANQRAGFGN